MDGRRSNSKVSLHFGFGGRTPVDFRVIVDEREILTLKRGKYHFVKEDPETANGTRAQRRGPREESLPAATRARARRAR